MAKNFGVKYYGHNSIYVDEYLKDNYKKRKFGVKFSIPSEGVNERTGILLLIAGFGAQCDSKVYKKIRQEFADKYNLVTLQCNYFGYEFMQSQIDNCTIESIDLLKLKISTTKERFGKIFSNNTLNINEYFNSNLKYKNEIVLKSNLNETLENFNDMGVMQALDNIVATLKVINYLKRKKLKFNSNKIIIMGNSHGSYLAYLCNVMCKGLYTHILDNSSWIYPVYYKKDRYIVNTKGNSALTTRFEYMIKNIKPPVKVLNLKDLYEKVDNKCKIIVYHGINDNLITAKEKYEVVKNIPNTVFNLITTNNIDNVIFNSTYHGLGADFIKLFEKFYREYCNDIPMKNEFSITNKVYLFDGLKIDFNSGLPELTKYD